MARIPVPNISSIIPEHGKSGTCHPLAGVGLPHKLLDRLKPRQGKPRQGGVGQVDKVVAGEPQQPRNSHRKLKQTHLTPDLQDVIQVWALPLQGEVINNSLS